MKKIYLYIIVAVCGASVLSLEILGTRILGPFYGVSIFLWSALITVTLAGLSFGYLLGGIMADRKPAYPRLCTIILFSGIWTAAIPFMKQPFLSLSEPLGLRFAVLSAAFILFFPPLTLLGMVTPFAIKLKTERLVEIGKTAGTLYAVSTLASVISALAVGFFLIPSIGVTLLTIATGAILIAAALAGFIIYKKPSAAAVTAMPLLMIIFSAWIVPFEQPDPDRGLIAVEQSPYAELRVLDGEHGRHLLLDGGIHTVVDKATWESNSYYTAVMELPKYFFIHPGDALLIGLGGGSLMKIYARDGWHVDAVEIDPTVIKFARSYFGIKSSDGTIAQTDGRQFLNSTDRRYDVILLDAYGSSSIPFHLATKEAFALIASHLNRGGILAINVECVGWHDPLVNILTSTLKQNFANVLALPISEPPDQLGNLILLAGNRDLEPFREPERNEDFDPDWRYGPGYQKVHAWDNRFIPDYSGSHPVTDDLNRIDLYTEPIKIASRKELHRYFNRNGLDR